MIDPIALQEAQLAESKATFPARMVGGDLPLWSETGKKRWEFKQLRVLENPSYRCSILSSERSHVISGTCNNFSRQ